MNTDVEPLTERQVELEILHQQWLQHPCTKAAMEILNKHSKYITDSIANSASADTVSDSKIRQFAVQLKTCQTISTMLFDTAVFRRKV